MQVTTVLSKKQIAELAMRLGWRRERAGRYLIAFSSGGAGTWVAEVKGRLDVLASIPLDEIPLTLALGFFEPVRPWVTGDGIFFQDVAVPFLRLRMELGI